jgi:hypothetical protein|tara:strand:- start:1581 stop:2063 length:483 start_codon:yes stop_codon:yes gene_type:complete
MISLLGTLLGLGTSIVPEVIGFFKQKQADKHDLEMLEAKAKYADQMSKLKIKELDSEAEIAETKGLYEHDRSIDAGGFVNGLRGSVRPVITYMFFLMFAAVKGTMIYAMITNQNLDWTIAIETAWDSDTAAVFSAIIAFWFGNRAMSKARAWQVEKKQLK